MDRERHSVTTDVIHSVAFKDTKPFSNFEPEVLSRLLVFSYEHITETFQCIGNLKPFYMVWKFGEEAQPPVDGMT